MLQYVVYAEVHAVLSKGDSLMKMLLPDRRRGGDASVRVSDGSRRASTRHATADARTDGDVGGGGSGGEQLSYGRSVFQLRLRGIRQAAARLVRCAMFVVAPAM
jgi:hypothetical protein